MVSMKDIAAACSVSVATVSKALNDHSDIGEETKKRIREVAKQMGYLPNSMARALKTKRSYNIGVLFSDEAGSGLTHDYFSYMLDNFKRTVEEQGYDVTFLNNGKNQAMSYLEHCRYRSFDGVLIACTDFYDPQVLELVRSDIPVVTIDHLFDNCSCVMSDNVDGMTQLVQYAYDMGHRRIAYIHGADSSTTKARVTAYFHTVKKLGLEVPEEYVREAPYRNSKEAEQQTKILLELPEPPTCILYPDDFACYGGINMIHEKNLRVPEDVSVIGYDGTRIGRFYKPMLTTLWQDTLTIGVKAAEQMISLIENPKSTLKETLSVKGKLLIGDSVRKLSYGEND